MWSLCRTPQPPWGRTEPLPPLWPAASCLTPAFPQHAGGISWHMLPLLAHSRPLECRQVLASRCLCQESSVRPPLRTKCPHWLCYAQEARLPTAPSSRGTGRQAASLHSADQASPLLRAACRTQHHGPCHSPAPVLSWLRAAGRLATVGVCFACGLSCMWGPRHVLGLSAPKV